MKWAVELSEFDIDYELRSVNKGQVLADFVTEFIVTETQSEQIDGGEWKIFVDGSSNSKGSGAGLVLIAPNGTIIEQALQFGFQATNNEAEYEAIMAGLKLALELGAKEIKIYSDSQLVTNQVDGSFAAKEERMALYLSKVKDLLLKFAKYELIQLPHSENSHEDALASLASKMRTDQSRSIMIDVLESLSIEESAEQSKKMISTVEHPIRPLWMDEIKDYLQHESARSNFRGKVAEITRSKILYPK